MIDIFISEEKLFSVFGKSSDGSEGTCEKTRNLEDAGHLDSAGCKSGARKRLG